MASKFKVKVECECGSNNEVIIPKPDYFKPVTTVFKCDGCESQLQALVRKLSMTKNEVAVAHKLLKTSDTLSLLRMEKQNDEQSIAPASTT